MKVAVSRGRKQGRGGREGGWKEGGGGGRKEVAGRLSGGNGYITNIGSAHFWGLVLGG